MHPTRKLARAVLFSAALGATAVASMTTGALAQSTSPAVFVTNNVGDSVSSFTVNPNGSLNFVGVFPSGDGPQTVSLSPNGRWLCVANGTASTTTEEMRVFEVNSDATLSLRVTTTVPDSPLDVQWLSNSVVAVTHTALSGTNEVRTFNFNPGANSVTQVDAKPTGSFNTRLATTRNGTLLYANNTGSGASIFGFAVAPSGTLTQVDNEFTTGFAVNIAASNDGRHLYGAGGISGDGHRILGFEIDPSGGLTPTAAVSYTSSGTSPKVVALTGDDRILLAGHGTDATIHTFLRDGITGDLTETPFSFDVGDQGNLGDLQTLGNLMFVTHSFSDATGPTGLYSFTVNPDGSLTQNGPLLSTNGTRPEYIAAWTGVPEPSSALVAAALGMLITLRRRL